LPSALRVLAAHERNDLLQIRDDGVQARIGIRWQLATIYFTR
jgi:hypothetical protein